MLALSVSISTSSSPFLTSSPSDFSHLRIVPSSIESDRRGMATSGMAPEELSGGGARGGAGPARRRRGKRHGPRDRGQREVEDRPAALAVGDPDPAALALDDLAA